jgi:hypothetical protein
LASFANCTLPQGPKPSIAAAAATGNRLARVASVTRFFNSDVELRFLTKDDITGSSFELNGNAATPSTDPVSVTHGFGSDLLPNGEAMAWPLEQNGLSLANVDDIVVVLKYKVAA